jgi:hypothetical protein
MEEGETFVVNPFSSVWFHAFLTLSGSTPIAHRTEPIASEHQASGITNQGGLESSSSVNQGGPAGSSVRDPDPEANGQDSANVARRSGSAGRKASTNNRSRHTVPDDSAAPRIRVPPPTAAAATRAPRRETSGLELRRSTRRLGGDGA